MCFRPLLRRWLGTARSDCRRCWADGSAALHLRVAGEIPATREVAAEQVPHRCAGNVDHVSGVEDVAMVVGQRTVIGAEVERIDHGSIAGAVDGLPVTNAKHLAPRVVDEECRAAGLLLQSHYHSVVDGIAAVLDHIENPEAAKVKNPSPLETVVRRSPVVVL